MHHPKLIFHSMDDVFRLVEINPDLPDPDTFKDECYRRAVPKAGPPCTYGAFEAARWPDASVYTEEVYRKDYLYDRHTGRRIAYWRRSS